MLLIESRGASHVRFEFVCLLKKKPSEMKHDALAEETSAH